MTAAELRDLYLRRELSPVEVVEDALRRIETLDPGLGAFVTVDAEGAAAAAGAAERRYREDPEGARRLGLLGIPVSVKDTIATRGLRTTMGSLLRADSVPTADAISVERLRAAGAAILGKTNTSEFGWKARTENRVAGETLNPWDRTRTAGGSSGGAAAAVASGMGPLALGTDAAGSLRIPSSFCGTVGFKPSQGRVPLLPIPGVGTLAHHGPIARTVADAALLLDCVAGADPRDRTSHSSAPLAARLGEGAAGLRIGWCAAPGGRSPDPDVAAVARAALTALAEAGAVVEEREARWADPHPALWTIFAAATAAQHREDLERVGGLIDPGRRRQAEEGLRLSAADLIAAEATRETLYESVLAAMEGLDLLAMPTTPIAAFAAGSDGPDPAAEPRAAALAWSPYTYPFNLTGQPAVSVPCGRLGGLPVGLQLVGRWREDVSPLRAAAALERVRPWPRALAGEG